MLKAKKRPRPALASRVDLPVLMFLWKWKIATTHAIAVKFYDHLKTPFASYHRLCKLERNGYIRRRADEHSQAWVWALTRKGFDLVKSGLPVLREDGFDSEAIRHDRWVCAAHLGNCLVHDSESVGLFTEQQLRRFHEEHYPSWIPRTRGHRPDGYWRVVLAQGRKTIALEVELSSKTKADYRTIGYFYEDSASVDAIVWIVSTPGHATTICNEMIRAGSRAGMHHFFLLSEFKKHGWGAKLSSLT